VKTALKLKGLSGEAPTSHKNYKYFKQFLQEAETLRLIRWRSEGVFTSTAWKNVGLANVRSMDELEQASQTAAFKIYTRYVMQLDDVAAREGTVAGKLSSDASDMEKLARTLAMKKRSDSYVKSVLGLDKLSASELKNSANYHYYEVFLGASKKLFAG
jgi:hypothetical protein